MLINIIRSVWNVSHPIRAEHELSISLTHTSERLLSNQRAQAGIGSGQNQQLFAEEDFSSCNLIMNAAMM